MAVTIDTSPSSEDKAWYDPLKNWYDENIGNPVHAFEVEQQESLWPEQHTEVFDVASGAGSNLRHASAASALQNRMSEGMANYFGTDRNKLTDFAGGVGSFGAMLGHELPSWNTFWEGFQEGPNMNWLQNETTEDILANLYGIKHGGTSTDPSQEYETLKPQLAFKSGLLSDALLNIAEARNYSTKYDLRGAIAREDPSIFDKGFPHKDFQPQWRNNRNNRLRFLDLPMTRKTNLTQMGNDFTGGITNAARGFEKAERLMSTAPSRKRENVYEGL